MGQMTTPKIANDEGGSQPVLPMKPRMSPSELCLFENFARHADHYLEFGSGGSTCVAASMVKKSITSVDSSQEWLNKVADICKIYPDWIQPTLVFADIGPIGAWGTPVDETTREQWPSYHENVWTQSAAAEADFFMVDGRFRIACAMQILLRCRANAIIAVHDYRVRKGYWCIGEQAREIASSENISFFQKRPDQNDANIREILEQNKYRK
ncbi:hypothetical protein [Roseomonas sp. 18066]|uniref:hypothetical protein n=1 Tax=Roseomonas sp. 18066 TaxID=2681412 RepID=UPI00135936B6|nr:hypothetical protein [Roseomonas sp. 18066]